VNPPLTDHRLHRLAFVTDDVAIRVLVSLPTATAGALERELLQLACQLETGRVKGVVVTAHVRDALPASSHDPAWGAFALLQNLSNATQDLDLTVPPTAQQPFGLYDFVDEARHLDAKAAQCPATAPWDTWSFSFVRELGGEDDRLLDLVMRVPTTLRMETEDWLANMLDWLEENRYGYDTTIERMEDLPRSASIREALAHAQEQLRRHAHGDHPWLTQLNQHVSLAQAEGRWEEGQDLVPDRPRRSRPRA
jgi:hypothetical protein